MQHMTHISALGGLAEDILKNDTSGQYLTDTDLQAIGNINAYVKANLEIVLQRKNVHSAANVITAPATSYGVAKLIDTNSDPEDAKTAGVLLASAAASFLANKVAVSVIGPKFETQTDADTGDILQKQSLRTALANNAITALTILVSRNKITADQFREHKEAIEDELARAATIEKVEQYVDIASAIASGYHGYKRNGDSIGYGLAWALTMKTGLGIALAQGYAKPIN